MNEAYFRTGGVEDLHGAGGVVAADIDEGARAGLSQRIDDVGAIFRVRLVAGRAEPGIRRIAEAAQVGVRQRREVDEVALAEAADAVACAEHLGAGKATPDFQHSAGDRLVDDRGWTAALGDDEYVAQACPAPRLPETKLRVTGAMPKAAPNRQSPRGVNPKAYAAFAAKWLRTK